MRFFSLLRKSATAFVTQRFWYIIVALIVLAAVLFFRSTVVVLGLVILTVLSKLVEIPLPRGVNFDLSLFTLVVLQFVYGLPTALTLVIISYLIGLSIKGKLTHHVAGENLVFPPVGFLLTAFLISAFSYDLFATGMIAVAFYASLMTVAYGITYRFPIFSMLLYLVTILPFNYFVFQNFGQTVLGLL